MKPYWMLAIVCAALILLGAAPAQQRSRSCDEEIAELREAPGGRLHAALRRPGSCPHTPETAQAAANAYGRFKASNDTAVLEQLLAIASHSPDARVLGVVLSVVEDRSASDVSRITGFAALARLLSPNRVVRYTDLLGGIDAHGLPNARCSSGVIAGKSSESRLGEPAVRRIRTVARRIARDGAERPDVRSAAACV